MRSDSKGERICHFRLLFLQGRFAFFFPSSISSCYKGTKENKRDVHIQDGSWWREKSGHDEGAVERGVGEADTTPNTKAQFNY